MFELKVILQEEVEIVEGDVHSEIAAIELQLFQSFGCATEGVLFDFIRDLLGSVSEEDAGVGIAAAHFGAEAL